MPIIIKCKNCGAIYHYGVSPVSVKKILESISYCRYCGAPLYKDVRQINVLIKYISKEEDII